MNIHPAEDRLSASYFRSIAGLVHKQVGIRLPEVKQTMLEGRLRRRVRALGLQNLDAYAAGLLEGGFAGDEMVHLIDCVTTNKTDFFREPAHFEFLRKTAIPDLVRQREGRQARLKIWSAACSTGAEAYTIAMVLSEMQRTREADFLYAILGTDISTEVLEDARAAIYPKEMIEPVPKAMAERYFLWPREKGRAEVRVVPELRRKARFSRLNLMDDIYAVDPDVDVIFCRNVLIYFDKPTQRAVIDKLRSHLRPGGYLILGHSESMAGGERIPIRQVLPTIFQA